MINFVECKTKNEMMNMSENNTNIQVETQTPQRPQAKWFDAFVVLILFGVSQVVGGGLFGFLAPLIGVELPNEIMMESVDSEVVEHVRFLQSRMVAISYFISMVVAFVLVPAYARWRGWRSTISLSFRSAGWTTSFRLLCGYILMWCITIALEPLTSLLPGDQSALGGGGWLLVSAVLLAPLFEEVIFRGYIAGLLKTAYGGMVAWLLSSLIFGVVHVIPSVMLTATMSGLVLGFFYLRHRSLRLVIVLHAMNNLTACFLQTIDLGDTTLHEVLGDSVLYWSIYGVCAFISLTAFCRMAVVVSRIKSDNIAPKK